MFFSTPHTLFTSKQQSVPWFDKWPCSYGCWDSTRFPTNPILGRVKCVDVSKKDYCSLQKYHFSYSHASRSLRATQTSADLLSANGKPAKAIILTVLHGRLPREERREAKTKAIQWKCPGWNLKTILLYIGENMISLVIPFQKGTCESSNQNFKDIEKCKTW